MLHAGIRALNSLADLEILQSFNEKYFGNTVENRNPTLLEVLRFEEEILRQKVIWKEKYESVISSWITPKAAKIDLKFYKINEEQSNTEDKRTENNIVIKPSEEKQPVSGVKTEDKNQENITPSKTDSSVVNLPVLAKLTENPTPLMNNGENPGPAAVISTDKNAQPSVTIAARGSTPAAIEQIEPIAEEKKAVNDEVKPITEEKKTAVLETKPTTEEKKTVTDEVKHAADEVKPTTEEKKAAALETKPTTEEKKTVVDEITPTTEEKKTVAEDMNKPAPATAAESSKLVTTEDEKLALETHDSVIDGPKANSPNEEANEEKKPEVSKRKKSKRIIKTNKDLDN